MDCTQTHELRLSLEFGDLSGFATGRQSEIRDLKLRPQFGWGEGGFWVGCILYLNRNHDVKWTPEIWDLKLRQNLWDLSLRPTFGDLNFGI